MGSPLSKSGCLFCRSITNPFTSEEHVFAFSLGNKEKVLPRGVVCDRCNNGVLANLDESLLNFSLIKFLRTMNAVPNREGVIPVSRLQNMTISNPTGGDIKIDIGKFRHFRETDQGFSLDMIGNEKMTPKTLRTIARALYKIMLELIWLDHGSEVALSQRFDELRGIVLGERGFNGWIVLGTNRGGERYGMRYLLQDPISGKVSLSCELDYSWIKIISDAHNRDLPFEDGAKFPNATFFKF